MADGILDLSPEPKPEPVPVPPAVPPQTPSPQPVPYEFHKREGRHWPLLLAYGLAALLLAIGLVFGGRWAYRELKNDKSAPQTVPADTNKLPSAPPAANKSSGAASQTAPSTGSTPPNQGQPAGPLPKTGDGDE